jgi:poly [ADP-ribose] polymerase
MVSADNNNKYYNMIPNGSTFIVEYGRVDVTKATETYPISKWASKYKEKRKKGYNDVTHLVKENVKKASSGYKQIENPRINSLFETLQKFAKGSIKENYSISSDSVTQAQVDEAQHIVDELTTLTKTTPDISKINKTLIQLYTVIPRKMKNVRDHLLDERTKPDLALFRDIIDNEQKTLDVMAGQVKIQSVYDPSDESTLEHTILDALGIVVEPGGSEDETVVLRLMGPDFREFKSVYKVIHKNSRTLYKENLDKAANKKTDLFWHGSRNENWISILQSGLKIRPSNAIHTGSMFGDGIYFADKYRKSANYTSLRGSYWAKGSHNVAFLSLMDVHLGNQLTIARHNHDCYKYSRDYLNKMGGYDSVFAKGGADLINNEYVVYDNAQCTIKYLVQIEK